MIYHNKPENEEYFNYLGIWGGGVLTNYATCILEIKSRTSTAKATFNKKKTI
jgi:hypothetical protein